MDNPALYNKKNNMTRVATTDCLNEYSRKIKWLDSGDSAIDLGCGDGAVTCILKKYARNCDKFVACDINENMLKFAQEKYGDGNIIFRVLDLEGEIPNDMRGGFNHVFSFFLFHWIQNQEKAFKNIFDLLSAGGDCFSNFFGHFPLIYLYYAIAQDPKMKWGSTWIKDVDKFVSKYCYMENPVQHVTEILKDIGFINIDVQLKKMTYFFENIFELKDLLRAVEPFGMPDDVYEEFFLDYMAVGREMDIFDKNYTGLGDPDKTVPVHYELLVVHVTKPKCLPNLTS